jgi:hypothetical protein
MSIATIARAPVSMGWAQWGMLCQVLRAEVINPALVIIDGRVWKWVKGA